MIQQTYVAKQENREVPAYSHMDAPTLGYGLDANGNAKHFGNLTIQGNLGVTGTSTVGGDAAVANPVAGVGTGYKIARGVTAVTGEGTVVTGLATVVAVVATARDDPDGVALAMVSATIGDQDGAPAAGSFILKTWKVTATGDATLIAASASKSVNWVAVGT